MGFPRHLSQHVGGFVLTRDRLDEIVPVGPATMEDRYLHRMGQGRYRRAQDHEGRCAGAGHADLHPQGLRSHRTSTKARSYDLATVPREDPAVYEMLQQSRRHRRVPGRKPRADEHAAASGAAKNSTISSSKSRSCGPVPSRATWCIPICGGAAARKRSIIPRPRRSTGRTDELRAVLEKTLGVPLFQEQAMKLAIVAAKFTPEEANGLRRAMATFRNVGTIDRFREKMVGGMVRRGYATGFRRTLLQADRRLRLLRVSRKPCREFRASRLHLGLDQEASSGGFRLRAFEFAAHGLLCARRDRARRARTLGRSAPRRCEFQRVGQHAGAPRRRFVGAASGAAADRRLQRRLGEGTGRGAR